MAADRRKILGATFLGIALAAGKVRAGDDSSGLGPAVRKSVDELMREHGVPGMAIATTNRGHHAYRNFGVASRATGRAVTSDTLFEVGSVSKTFTATLASYANEVGRLQWTDSPAKFLPELAGTEIGKIDLLQFGTHTAGGFPLQLPVGIETTEQLFSYYRSWRPQYAPGTARTYSNPGIGLLGMVAAKAWGMPFVEAMQAMLFPDLGLHDTFIQVPPREMARYAWGYDKAGAPVRVAPGMLADEAYGVKTCTRDLIRFVDLHLAASKLPAALGRALPATRVGYFELGAMTQAVVWEQYEEQASLADLLEGNSSKVAYETQRVTRLLPPHAPDRAAWVNKTGATNGFGAYVAFRPEQRTGVVLLANKNYPIDARVRLAHRILEALSG